MYNVKLLNAISNAVYDHLPKDTFYVSTDIPNEEADAFLVRSFNCHDIPVGNRALAFGRAGAGVNNLPCAEFAKKGIVVFNTPGANANAVKELVLCAMLLSSRNVVDAIGWAKTLDGKGDEIPKLVESGKNQFVGPEIMGKTLGVIGLGAIGVMVANAATALGMNVIGYDPFISVDSAWNLSRSVHRAISLDELLTQSDYITVHVPLIEQTKGYIHTPEFSKMKKGVILLNFARNGIIKQSSLFKALEDGIVAKYVTDFPDAELIAHKGVISIPHLGASTPESEENCAKMAAASLKHYIKDGSIKNAVNMPDCILEAPTHCRITLIHNNLPNMVSQMTAIIGQADINIEEMVNKSKSDIAYTVFDLNKPVSDALIKKLTAIDGVIRIRKIGW